MPSGLAKDFDLFRSKYWARGGLGLGGPLVGERPLSKAHRLRFRLSTPRLRVLLAHFALLAMDVD